METCGSGSVFVWTDLWGGKQRRDFKTRECRPKERRCRRKVLLKWGLRI